MNVVKKFFPLNNVLILVCFSVLILFIAVIFNFFGGKQNNQIVQMLDFSCSSINDLNFKYPVFKGWEILSIKEGKGNGGAECFIVLNYPQGINVEEQPRIIITKQPYSENDFEIPVAASSSPNGVSYIYTKEGSLSEIKNYGYVGFYGKNFKYWVALDGISEKSGFPVDQFFKTVIQSFKKTE